MIEWPQTDFAGGNYDVGVFECASKRSLRLCLRLRLCVCVVFLLCCRVSVSNVSQVERIRSANVHARAERPSGSGICEA